MADSDEDDRERLLAPQSPPLVVSRAEDEAAPANYGAVARAGGDDAVLDVDEDGKVMETPSTARTVMQRVHAYTVACLIWLGLANPPAGTAADDDGDDGAVKPERAPLSEKATKYKLFALLCSCLISIGSHYASQMLSALKPVLKEELGITNTQYSLLQAAVSLVNTVVPLFGGQFIDVFGTGWGSIMASTLILVGNIIVALSTEVASYPIMVLGRLVYGVGAGCIVTVQEAILAHWFHGRGLAIAVGLQVSMSRLSSFLATGTVNEIAEATGFYGNAFWVSTAICAFSWLCNFAYVQLLRRVGEPDTVEKLRARLRQKSMFNPAILMRFPLSFWIVIALSLAFGIAWGPFTHITTELVIERFGSDTSVAAWQASVALAVPVIGSPFIGLICDKYGQRPFITVLAAVTLVLSFLLVGFTYADPTIGLAIFSVSLTIGPIALISAVPLLLPLTAVGTALGLYKCATNIGATIMDPLSGLIQDIYGQYNEVMFVFTGFALATFVMTIIFWVMDFTHFQRILTANEAKRKAIEKKRGENLRQILDASLERPIPRTSWIAVGIFLLLLLFSWVIYIILVVYSANLEDTPPDPVAATALLYSGGVNGVLAWCDDSAWLPLDVAGLNGTAVHALALATAATAAGGVVAANTAGNVVAWTGESWTTVGPALGGAISALAEVNGTLWAGGALGAAPLVAWNGSAWTTPAGIPALDGPVRALLVGPNDGALYVGGAFTGGLARWDGVQWTPLVVNGTVNILAAGPGGAIYAGGAFSGPGANVAQWANGTWTPLGAGLSTAVGALAVVDTADLAGVCTARPVATAVPPVDELVCWDGATWTVPAGGAAALNGTIAALAVAAGVLVAGGDAGYVAQWTAQGWAPLGSVGWSSGTVSALLAAAHV